MQSHAAASIYLIAALSTAGVMLRPFNLAEAVWAVAGAALLVALGLISIPDTLTGIAKGGDVYLFLFGMMLLAEIARVEGLFDWLAAVPRRRLGAPAVSADLRRRHRGDRFSVERRHGGGAHARSHCFLPSRPHC